MTVQRFPSAVYHCNLPVSSASAVYGSSNNGRRLSKSQNPPIPAWPDIEDIDQWCCLPTLKRTPFFCLQGKQEPQAHPLDLVLAYIENHWGEYSPEVAHLAWLLSYVGDSFDDFVDIAHMFTDEARRFYYKALHWTQSQLLERGAEDAFSCAHELGHVIVGSEGVYSAFLQNAQADIVHGLLETIATTPQLSPRDLRQLWNDFFAANEKLVQLVQKFKVVDEIVATQQGLLLSPPEVQDAVFDQLYQIIRNDGYWSLFYTFLIKGCRENPHRALPLMELFTILLDRLNISRDEALLRSIAVLDTMVETDASLSLDDVDEWIAAKAPMLEPLLSAVIESRHASHWPCIALVRRGNKADLEIRPVPTIGTISVESILWQVFWESLRQQIRWSVSTPPFKVRRLICPYKRDATPCCGRSNLIKTLWVRIPKRWRAALPPPTCNS